MSDAVEVYTRVYKCCNASDCVIKGGSIAMITEKELAPFIGKRVRVIILPEED